MKQAIEAGEKKFGKKGRLVIRASGTEPLIRVMAEGDDSELVTGRSSMIWQFAPGEEVRKASV